MQKWVLLGIFIFIVILHTWQLAEVPRGLYVDESSIGLNAALLSQSGRDEHGVFFPIFFEAFGEYKNPIYIYVAAGVMKLAGVSEFTLRFTSAVFFGLFMIGWIKLLQLLFPKQPVLLIIGMWVAGTLPWFFALSRIAFEVISQLTVMTWLLLTIYQTYVRADHKHPFSLRSYPLWTGVLLGISAYTYTTARLLTPLICGVLFICFYQRKYWLRHVQVLLTTGIMLLPMLIFVVQQPDALTQRFKDISYWHDSALSTQEKVSQFSTNMLQYASPKYLFYTGDSNQRHHSGYGGLVFVAVVILAVVGGVSAVQAKKQQRWFLFLVILAVVSIIPAALAGGDSSLRSLVLGVVVLIFAMYGWVSLSQIEPTKTRQVLQSAVLILLLWESSAYLHHYFVVYPKESISAFQSYDTRSSLHAALQMGNEVIFSNRGNEQYAHAAFYALTLGLEPTEVIVGEPVASEQRCVVVSAFDEYVWFEEQYELEIFYAHDPDDFVKIKCFGNLLPE